MKSIVIHGHFYQPPRENPWTQTVEREASAAPSHDWNERIFKECYRANAYARIFDDQGLVETIVNNYEYLSFNVGPTLMLWMQREHPLTYRRILAADAVSARRCGGHGNAMAQGYNHAILPLCNTRDRITQIRWGLADFAYRFGRPSEGIWLPETAANDDTLDTLIDEKVRFTILSPYQAYRVRRIGQDHWREVGGGRVDPSMAYRYFHRDGSGRYLDIIFYDGPRSKAIAFEGALDSSTNFLANLTAHEGGEGNLVTVATDGESYGHHASFGDRAISHAVAYEAPRRGLRITNYAQFLDENPPTHEVQIHHGPDGKGSSWSCAHGVGRWYRNCSCNAGGPAGWDQNWRQPLRDALDMLRDAAAEIFEDQGERFFRDPWQARDAYIDVLLDDRRAERFARTHLRRRLSGSQGADALGLLSTQHHAMLMYTSCGWFFSDLSGIETQQILKYAGRVIDELRELSDADLEAEFLERLALAKSNKPEEGNGADIYRKYVDSCRVTPDRVTAHVAMSGLIEAAEPRGEVAGYRYEKVDFRTKTHGTYKMGTGRIDLVSTTTGRRHSSIVAAMHLGGVDFYSVLRPFTNRTSFLEAAERMWATFFKASLPSLLRQASEEFGPKEFGVEDLLPDSQELVPKLVWGQLLTRFSMLYANLYEANQRTLDKLQSSGFEIPAELRAAAEFTLGATFEAEVRRQGGSTDPRTYRKAIDLAQSIQERGYRVDDRASTQAFEKMITTAVHGALENPTTSRFNAVERLIEVSRQLGLQVKLLAAEEAAYEAGCRGVEIPKALLTALRLSSRAFDSMDLKIGQARERTMELPLQS